MTFKLYCVSDSDLVSVRSGEINSISDTQHDSEKGGDDNWKKTVLKKKKASTNSSLSVKSLGFQLVMNLQPCATAFCIAKTSTLNICYLSSLSGLSMLCRGSNLLYNLTIVMLTATFCVLHPQEQLLVICLSYVRTLQIWDSAKCLPKEGLPQLSRFEPLLYSY